MVPYLATYFEPSGVVVANSGKDFDFFTVEFNLYPVTVTEKHGKRSQPGQIQGLIGA